MPEVKHHESEQISTRLSHSEARQIEKLVSMGFFMNGADFLRSAVREKLSSIEIHEVHSTTIRQAKQEILRYLKKNGSAFPSDIALELGLDLETTMRAVKELWGTKKIEEAGKA